MRRRLGDILDLESLEAARLIPLADRLFHRAANCTLELPAAIGDYTDFYAGIHHARNTGTMLRPDMPLPPNYKYLPIAYHGRASSIRPSGTAIRRPHGQRKRASESEPSFGPSRNLDYELELGIWLGPGNELGEPIPIAQAADHIAGYCLLNDWSARDLQAWETVPLGPFIAKSFVTSLSPWVVTAEALEPFRRPQEPRPEGDPKPLDYLWDEPDQHKGALDVALEAYLSTEAMRAQNLPPQRLALSNSTHLYWTPAQLVAHHASAGCNLGPGDLFGSGTISGPHEDALGSLLELSQGGRKPIPLVSGETRRFLEDGDEVIFRACCRREYYTPIGFGECRGRVVSAQ